MGGPTIWITPPSNRLLYIQLLEQPLDILKLFIFRIHPLSGDEWQAFAGIWQEVAHKRKTVLTAAGETERYLYFVLEGVQRAFYVGTDHLEATIVFTYPHSGFYCAVHTIKSR
jgi:hypothetical protein